MIDYPIALWYIEDSNSTNVCKEKMVISSGCSYLVEEGEGKEACWWHLSVMKEEGIERRFAVVDWRGDMVDKVSRGGMTLDWRGSTAARRWIQLCPNLSLT